MKGKIISAGISALTELVPELLQMVDEDKIALRPAVELLRLFRTRYRRPCAKS